MLKTYNLSKTFLSGFFRKKVKALDSLNLEIKPNEIFGFLGPNGAGKTTAIKLFMGLLKPSEGRVEIFGEQTDFYKLRQRIGFLPENPYFYDYLTALELLHYYGQLFRLGKNLRKKRIEELLELVELQNFANMRLRNFSKGMLQRLGIAQALINDPEFLVLDEPMSGLDPIGRRKIRDIILDLKAKGKTIFFSTHILWDVELICDRVGILAGGKLKNIGDVEEMLRPETGFTEIIFNDISEEGLAEINRNFHNTEKKGNKVLVRAKNEFETELALSLAGRKKAKIFSFNPERQTLENIFIKETQKSE
ncbi:MAG: ABC transporter ATP-binding protein [Candidatus Omnitrophota bacterium]